MRQIWEGGTMVYAVGYGSALLAYCVIDMAWLALMYSRLYRPALTGLLAPAPKITPAIIFYLLYPVGIVIFAVLPSIGGGSATAAFLLGALFGGLSYATYALTNHATLRGWKLRLSLMDICWGAFVTGASATLSYYATIAMRPVA